MKIFVTGDTHGFSEYKRIHRFRDMMRLDLDSGDILIVLGDFGFVWDNKEKDHWMMQRVWGDFPCRVFWIDGNHENFDLLREYPEDELYKGKIRHITDNIKYLQRGQVFEIEGYKIFTFGGAKSVDRGYGKSTMWWWKEELPSLPEMDEALRNLKRHDNVVDYILTHECRYRVLQKLFRYDKPNTVEFNAFLRWIDSNVVFKKWYFAHHHEDRGFEKYRCVFKDFLELGEEER